MESFEFEIPFDEEREKKALKVQLKYLWKKNLTWAAISFAFSAILLLLILTAKIPDRGREALMIFAFLYGLYILYLYYKASKTAQKRLKIITPLLKEKGIQKIFFNDLKFGSSNGFGDCEFSWNNFTTYENLDGHLIVFHAARGTSGIVVSVAEIGQENFARVLAAVQTKIAELKNEVQ
jgi:hypothetical protein